MTRPKTICCPPFNPKPWDNKTIIWKKKKFVKASVFCLFYFPLNFSFVIRRLDKKIQSVTKMDADFICLSDHTSPFKMDIYVAVEKTVPTLENVTLSGMFYSKVYEGPFTQMASWCRDFHALVHKKHLKVDKGYVWYAMCPECTKVYGKNYVVVIGKVSKE